MVIWSCICRSLHIVSTSRVRVSPGSTVRIAVCFFAVFHLADPRNWSAYQCDELRAVYPLRLFASKLTLRPNCFIPLRLVSHHSLQSVCQFPLLCVFFTWIYSIAANVLRMFGQTLNKGQEIVWKMNSRKVHVHTMFECPTLCKFKHNSSLSFFNLAFFFSLFSLYPLTRPQFDLGRSPLRFLRGKTSPLGQAAWFDSGFGIIGVAAL